MFDSLVLEQFVYDASFAQICIGNYCLVNNMAWAFLGHVAARARTRRQEKTGIARLEFKPARPGCVLVHLALQICGNGHMRH